MPQGSVCYIVTANLNWEALVCSIVKGRLWYALCSGDYKTQWIEMFFSRSCVSGLFFLISKGPDRFVIFLGRLKRLKVIASN